MSEVWNLALFYALARIAADVTGIWEVSWSTLLVFAVMIPLHTTLVTLWPND